MTSLFLHSLLTEKEQDRLNEKLGNEIQNALIEEDNFCALEEMGLDDEYDAHKIIIEARQERKGRRV